jgi:chromosome partitioning protein
MKTLAIANHKGGVGKTATTHNLGAALAMTGRRVIMIDIDPQGSLSGACGITPQEGQSLADVLGGAQPGSVKIADVVIPLSDTLYLVPGDLALSITELGLVSRLGRENALKKALASVGQNFDVCLIDCPPSISLLTLNALAAADAVIVPTQPLIVDLRGLKLFLDTLENVKADINPELKILGVLVTFHDGRLAHHKQAMDFIKSAGLPIMDTIIGKSVRVADAAAAGQAVVTLDPGNPQAANYSKLAEEVDAWLKQ